MTLIAIGILAGVVVFAGVMWRNHLNFIRSLAKLDTIIARVDEKFGRE
jgi:hypothetical protein